MTVYKNAPDWIRYWNQATRDEKQLTLKNTLTMVGTIKLHRDIWILNAMEHYATIWTLTYLEQFFKLTRIKPHITADK
jgi:hypothetical protein